MVYCCPAVNGDTCEHIDTYDAEKDTRREGGDPSCGNRVACE